MSNKDEIEAPPSGDENIEVLKKYKPDKVDKRKKGVQERSPAQIASVAKMIAARKQRCEEIKLVKEREKEVKKKKKKYHSAKELVNEYEDVVPLERTKSQRKIELPESESESESEPKIIRIKKKKPVKKKKKKQIIYEESESDSESEPEIIVRKVKKKNSQTINNTPTPPSNNEKTSKPPLKPKRPISRYEYMKLLGF